MVSCFRPDICPAIAPDFLNAGFNNGSKAREVRNTRSSPVRRTNAMKARPAANHIAPTESLMHA